MSNMPMHLPVLQHQLYPNPWYGVGQGASDAAPQLVVLFNSLSSAYISQATPWLVSPSDQSTTIQVFSHAFMDDTMQTNTIHPTDQPY